jgi:hypothetical protein
VKQCSDIQSTKVKSALSIMAKLTRDQIAKGLESVPMSQVLQGAQGTIPKLSARQVEFAKQVALCAASQSEAYRSVYSKGNSTRTVNKNASVLANDSRVQTAIKAFKTAQAYAEYQTPSQLRQLVVSQLTKHVLDEDFPPAQRVACLKLLGSVAEIGLFVDRKETLVVHQSSDIRAKLLEQLRTITGQVTEVTDDADSLLAEINSAKSQGPDPTVPVPPVSDVCVVGDYIHTIPLEITSENSIPLEISNENSNSDKLHESGELQPPHISDENVSR